MQKQTIFRAWCIALFALLLVFAPQATIAQEAVTDPNDLLQIEAPEAETPPADSTEVELPGTEATIVDLEPEPSRMTFTQRLDDNLQRANDVMFGLLLFDLSFGTITPPEGLPSMRFLVVFLLFGAIVFTIAYGFVNFRGFTHAWVILSGRLSKNEDEGEVSHFRALTSALSATVGLGNIAGVAIAINLGGPGAVFWMLVTALFGMASKFNSCTLALLYRKVNVDGTISGGPMYYLDKGLGERGGAIAVFGKVLAVVFAIFIMGSAIGGGNMFQVNQSFEVLHYVVQFENKEVASYFYGGIIMLLVGLVIIGGIKRIGAATSRIVPAMAVIYALGCLVVIFTQLHEVIPAIGKIFGGAFSFEAGLGGFIGVMIIGIQRAVFSSEAGLGSAAVAHAAAKTKEPVREGFVGMLEPFVDTIIICSLTALVILVTGVYAYDQTMVDALVGETGAQGGAALTAEAFSQVIAWFPIVLAIAVILFAYSTMISWGYYGERGWIYLMDHFGEGVGINTLIVFRVVYISMIMVGAVAPLASVLDFADVLLLSLAFPNILGSFLLIPKVRQQLKNYMYRKYSGEFKLPTKDLIKPE